MPELPEVEVITKSLNLKIQNQVISDIVIRDHTRLKPPPFSLKNYQVEKVFRLGKTILIQFSGSKAKDIFLEVHLRMTGRLLFEKYLADFSKSKKNLGQFVNKILSSSNKNIESHIRAEFKFKDGYLLFVDPRKFGTFKWHTEVPLLAKNSIDALDPEFSEEMFFEMLHKHRKQNIKNFLMDQKRIVGIGNIYASEILFLSGTSPKRVIEKISKKKKLLLHKNIKKVLLAAIKNNGTTFSDYQREDGSKGGYQFKLKVYGREGLDCKKCGTIIKRLVQGQRSTFYCGKCQR